MNDVKTGVNTGHNIANVIRVHMKLREMFEMQEKVNVWATVTASASSMTTGRTSANYRAKQSWSCRWSATTSLIDPSNPRAAPKQFAFDYS